MKSDDEEVNVGSRDDEDAKMAAAPSVDLSSEQTMAPKLGLPGLANLSRKEKRKQLKKLRRKQIRQQVAEEEKLKESAGLDDKAEQLRIQLEEQIEAERFSKEKAEHDEQERLWLEREKKAIEDFQHQQEELRKLEEDKKHQNPEEGSEYVDDDGPAEIIWKGNEIIVKKRRVKVLADPPASLALQDTAQATSNPLPPQSAVFAAHNKYSQPPVVSEQTTVFGTEQDKTHCPFHIKTGVCRFGVRCSRVHVYPDHSFTLLVRNMYTGPGLAWDNDEGLESYSVEQGCEGRWMARAFGGWMKGNEQPVYPADSIFVGPAFAEMCEHGNVVPHSDEEVAQHYEEFYDDVHSEFLHFGELVNFKVCNNVSSHLRGNLYVHYKAEASAQGAYSALNGRFYAGKQITCEFVGVLRWRVALCGEYMKGRHRCSHGSACNFLHCFRNPRGEYDWADWDAPRPRSWAAKMAKTFGYESDLEHEHDYEFHDDRRLRHRSPDSPSQRESRHREHRSRDRHHHSSRDDLESSGRRRGHKKPENGSDGLGRSSRHRGHRRRDVHDLSSPKVLDERGRGSDWETDHGRRASESESGTTRDYHELKGDRGEQQQKRHKTGSADVEGEVADRFTHESRRVSPRDRSGFSNRLFQDTDDESNYKRHRSRDYKDSDSRQSLDLRSGKGRRSRTSERISPTNIESKTKDVPIKAKYHEKGIETRTRNSKSDRSVDDSISSDDSGIDHSRKRHRGHHHTYSEGRSRRRKKNTQEHVIESEENSPNQYDRWTGDMNS